MSTPHPTSRLRRATRRTAKWACTILAGAMVIVWIGSRWQWIHWKHEVGWPYFELRISSGMLQSNGTFVTLYPASHFPTDINSIRWVEPPVRFLEWAWAPSYLQMSGKFYLVLPLWIPTLAFALPAALLWGIELRRRRRATRVGHCATCGYSLLGTPLDNPCPECGTARE